jgi:ATP-dependent exoDNAse (exonuclease V) alpha subunit
MWRTSHVHLLLAGSKSQLLSKELTYTGINA